MKNTNNTNNTTRTNVLPFKKTVSPESTQSATQELHSAKHLAEILERKARERGQNLWQVANELSVTYGFLLQLQSGLRPATNLSDDFTEACAKYLEVSRFEVLLLAGRITVYDMFPSPHDPKTKQFLDVVCARADVHDAFATLSAMEIAISERRKASATHPKKDTEQA